MNEKNLRSYALALLFLAIALGSMARTLRIADSGKTTMSITSGVLSLCAIAIFIKAARPERRLRIFALIGAGIVAAAVITFLVLHH